MRHARILYTARTPQYLAMQGLSRKQRKLLEAFKIGVVGAGYVGLVTGELEEVYHFASPASPADFERIPIPILKVGALGTYNSLGLAKAKGARLMLASTSEVYGDPLVHPQPEEYWGNVNPTGIRGVYDEAKRYAESEKEEAPDRCESY